MKRRQGNESLQAFTLVELLVIIASLLILALLILVPASARKRKTLTANCSNNLKQVGLAFRVWELDGGDKAPMHTPVYAGGTLELIDSRQVFVHFLALSNELATPRILVCPSDPAKTMATNFSPSFNDKNVSYFVGVDSEDISPLTLRVGDRNLVSKSQPLGAGLFALSEKDADLGWTKKIHRSCGNICKADGSVRLLDGKQLTEAARNQGIETNRLCIP